MIVYRKIVKKLIPLLLLLVFVLTLIGCTSEDKATFQATILEIQDGYYLVEPVEGMAGTFREME